MKVSLFEITVFYNINHPELIQIQDAYVNRLLEETASYGNIIYEICNEYTGAADWAGNTTDATDAADQPAQLEQCPNFRRRRQSA